MEMNADRLPMMEDYMNANLVIELKAKARRRGIKVVVITDPIDISL